MDLNPESVPTDAGLAVVNAILDGRRVGLRAVSGRIAAVGPDVSASPGDRVIDAAGMALLPGLVNGHTHAAMTLFRGYASDLKLREWLEHWIWPAERNLSAADVYWGARLAALEMIRAGTTRFFDMYWYPAATGRAARDAGLRVTAGAPLLDGGDPARFAEVRAASLESLAELSELGPLVTPSLTPHSTYMVSERSLRWVAEEAAQRQLPVHIHFAETVREVAEWQRDHKQSLTEYLDGCGLLGPSTLLAHGCVMEAADYQLAAERGATIVTNPVSNLKLANGRIFPYPVAAASGVSLGLGTDGAASNNSLDLFADVKVFALLQKHAANDPTVLPAPEALAIAQGQRSALLGGGPIESGTPADFILIRTDLPQLNPGELVDNLVYAASGEVVDTTVVAGQVLMRHREIPAEPEVIEQVRARSYRLRPSAVAVKALPG